MFNEKDYKAAFSQVKASEETHMEVLNMANRRKNRKNTSLRRAVVLAAAVIALMAMTVTAFAAEDIALWFRSYFSLRGELSQQQVEYLAENEQVIGQSKTNDGWTVELRSAIHDDTTGYIILGVTAPVDTELEAKYDKNGDNVADFIFGNLSTEGHLSGAAELLTPSDNVRLSGWGWRWAEDGDGLNNTRNIVIDVHPWLERCETEPFGSGAVYSICLEDIVREYEDKAYKQALMNGKYAGHKDVCFDSEETKRLYPSELLAEGTWDFTVTFAEPAGESFRVELLEAPVSTTARFLRYFDDVMGDWYYAEETVMLTSVVMQPLTVTFYCAGCNGIPELTDYEDTIRNPYVVLKDGTQIELWSYGSRGTSYVTLVAEQPIVFEEVDHILMTDGSIIPIPEPETK